MLKSRYLPWVILTPVTGLAVALWAAGTPGTTKPLPPGPAPLEKPGSRSPDHGGERHYVTPRQLADSNTMVSRALDALQAVGQDGRHLGWDELSAGRPVALVFIKEGCPCTTTFEPFFGRVEKLYRGEARFAAVIDAGTEAARRHASEQHLPYPVLADPERRIIRRLRAENGGYVVLLTADGVIDGFWPGCSADALRDLGRRIARLAGREERPLNVSGMPGSLTTGCPFESEAVRALSP
jgi:peroxiredoxin